MNLTAAPALLQNDDVISRDNKRSDQVYTALGAAIAVGWVAGMAALASWAYREQGFAGAVGVVVGVHVLLAVLFVAVAYVTLDRPSRPVLVLTQERLTEAFAAT